MNIAIFTQTFPLDPADGTAHFMYDFAHGLAQAGHTVFVLVPFHRSLKPQKFRGIHVVPFRYITPDVLHVVGYGRTVRNDQKIPWFIYILTPLYILFGSIALLKLIRNEHIHVVNAHWIVPNGFCAALVSRITGVPLIITLPGTDVYLSQTNLLGRLMSRAAIASALQIVSNSPQLLNDLRITGPVISYGVPRARQRHVHKGIRIVTAGRRVEKKGIEFVQSVCPDIEVLSGLSINTFRNTLLSVDIFIAGSIRDRKGNLDDASMTVLEAMAAGCAIITSDLPGYRRIIEQGKNGILVPPGDKVALEHAINKLRGSGVLRQRLGTAARKTIAERLTPKRVAASYTALFRRAIAT